jgi:hypothetical protein
MSGKRKSFKCGHWGFGLECHRCHQAIEFLDLAKKEPKAEKAAQLKAEGERLLNVPRKVSSAIAPSDPVPV